MLLVHIVLAVLLRWTDIVAMPDPAEYALLARALQEFTYRDLYLAGAPLHTHFPPVYPALLAAWGLLFGNGFGSLVWINILASTATLAVLFVVLRKLWSPYFALLCLAALAVNPVFLYAASSLYSETVYSLVSVLCLAAVAGSDPSRRGLAVAATLAITAALTRSIGVSLLAAVCVHWLLERRWKLVVSTVGASVVFVGGWILWTMAAPVELSRSYMLELQVTESAAPGESALPFFYLTWRQVSRALGINLPSALALPSLPGVQFDNILVAAVATICVAVGLWCLVRRWRAAGLYVMAYIAVLIAWPWFLGRFYVPLVPFFVAAAVLGAGAIGRRIRPSREKLAMLLLTLAMIAGGVIRSVAKIPVRRGCDGDLFSGRRECVLRDEASFLDAAAYVRDSLSEDAVILTAKSSPLAYHSGRRTVSVRPIVNWSATDVFAYSRTLGVSHVLLASVQQMELGLFADRVTEGCDRLEVERFFPPRTFLFRVLPAGTPPDPERSACTAVEEYRRLNVGRDFLRDP
jgi:hypothetical protein